jgi:hypothetical protein
MAFVNFGREVGLIIFRNFPARGLAPIYAPRENSEICTAFGKVWKDLYKSCHVVRKYILQSPNEV